MTVEIENGEIIGYTRISKWSEDNHISPYSLARKIKEGAIDKSNFIRLGNITYIKNTFTPSNDLNIRKPEKSMVKYHVINGFPSCSTEEMYEIIEDKLGHSKQSKKIISALKNVDFIKNFDDLAKWINDCIIVKYTNSEGFIRPYRRFIYGLGIESYNALRGIFVSK